MNTLPCHRDDDEGYEMPAADALLAGTLALMTGHAESACARHKGLMSKKIVSNLFFLAEHPSLNPHFRRVVLRMHGHWAHLVDPAGPTAALREMAAGDVSLTASTHWH
jgi:hypothetical protein